MDPPPCAPEPPWYGCARGRGVDMAGRVVSHRIVDALARTSHSWHMCYTRLRTVRVHLIRGAINVSASGLSNSVERSGRGRRRSNCWSSSCNFQLPAIKSNRFDTDRVVCRADSYTCVLCISISNEIIAALQL